MLKAKLFAFIFVLSFLTYQSVAQQIDGKKDDIPKGNFSVTSYIPEKNYTITDYVLSADAKKMASEWEINGFSLKNSTNETALSTGKYTPNASLSATSPTIALPAIGEKDKLFLILDETFDVEYHYDFIHIVLNLDGETNKTIYTKTGKTERVTDYIDLTTYAGKTLRISLQLVSNDAHEGDGWTIYNLSVGVQRAMAAAKKMTTATVNVTENAIHEIIISDVNTNNFPDEITVSFLALDKNGNHISGLKEEDFNFKDEGFNIDQITSCFQMREIDEQVSPHVDLIFLFDNSGSMDSHITQVKNALGILAGSLSDKCDLRVSLARFGISTSSYPCFGIGDNFRIESVPGIGGGIWWYLDTNSKLLTFKQFIENNTTTDGWLEQGWEALKYLSTAPIEYRNYAQKVIVLLGDEPINDGDNNYEYCNGTKTPFSTTQQDVINALKGKGFQAFMIIGDDGTSQEDYAPIATATGGTTQTIFSNDYSSVMDKIASKISGKYTLSYCLDKETPITEACRTLTISSASNSSVSGSKCYIITPKSIKRTAATKALDKTVQPRKTIDVTVGVTVCATVGVDSVVLYYKAEHDLNFSKITLLAGKSENSTCSTFNFDIPAQAIDSSTVEYKFDAFLSDGTKLASIPSDSQYDTWTFAVAPNFPPVISDVTIIKSNLCSPITIRAKITDATEYLVNKQLHYRINRTASAFKHLNMTPCGSCGADIYEATIPAGAVGDAGLLYYIYATDNHNAQGWYGTPETPVFLQTFPNSLPNSEERKNMIVNIRVKTTGGILKCGMLKEGDILRAYFHNDCGDQIGGELVVTDIPTDDNASIGITLIGDDPNDAIIDGFRDGDAIELRIVRDGYEYTLPTSPAVFFYNGDERTVSPTSSTAGIPAIEISYSNNNQIILPGSTDILTSLGTDFGTYSGSPHTFKITNTGCATLTIKDIQISDNVNFSKSHPAVPFTIAVGSSQVLELYYNGQATATAKVTVSNNGGSFPNDYTFLVSGRNNSTPTFDAEMEILPGYGQVYINRVTFLLDAARTVTIKIYDYDMNLKKVIFGPESMVMGNHAVYFQITDLPFAKYFCVMESEGQITRKQFEIKK